MAAAVWVTGSGVGSAQQTSPRTDKKETGSAKASNPKERVSGVIIKMEPVPAGVTAGSTIQKEAAAGRARPATHRLTINMNAVWRDWARDQAHLTDKGPAKKDAAAGKNSVATTGEPAEPNSVVVVDVGPDTRVETRFRSLEDETGRGSKAPETAQGGAAPAKSNSAAKPVQFRAEDLKPGLFVEADFRHVPAQNPVSIVTVIRPIENTDVRPADRTKK